MFRECVLALWRCSVATEPVGRVRLGFAGLHRVSVRCDSLRAPKVCCGHRACGSSAARAWWLRQGVRGGTGICRSVEQRFIPLAQKGTHTHYTCSESAHVRRVCGRGVCTRAVHALPSVQESFLFYHLPLEKQEKRENHQKTHTKKTKKKQQQPNKKTKKTKKE